MKYRLLAAILLITLSAPAQQAATRPKSSNQVTTTRTVHIFGELERELGAALHSGDQATVDRLLAPDFEVRRSSAPAVPVPRAEFIGEKHPPDTKFSQMAVRMVGSTALASFVASDASASHFIVDTWAQDGSGWKLVERYESPTTASADQAPAQDKRPTGKQ
jgi:hypothetical protein